MDDIKEYLISKVCNAKEEDLRIMCIIAGRLL